MAPHPLRSLGSEEASVDPRGGKDRSYGELLLSGEGKEVRCLHFASSVSLRTEVRSSQIPTIFKL